MKRQLSSDTKIDDLGQAKAVLQARYKELEAGPYDPSQLAGLPAAMEVIIPALAAKERIMVFGDFDADGITATVVLVDVLRRLGGEVSYRMPDRATDSHGLKNHHVDEIVAAGARLLITVDGGINDREAVQYAHKQGLPVIITDHHQSDPNRFPDKALAVLNPHQAGCPYPEKNLSGVGVVFKLVAALAGHFFPPPNPLPAGGSYEASVFCKKYLDVVAIGLVADCMPLTGEVRTLVKQGLVQLQNTEWKGLKVLLEELKIDPDNISEDTIGFYLGPVINAASRLGEVGPAVQLFLGNSPHENIAYLLELNNARKQWSKTATAEAQEQIDSDKSYQLIITTDWPVGVLGLVAGQIAEKTQQPVIVMREEGNAYKASCRAPVWADIEQALRTQEGLFTHVGGHPAAAGFLLPAENLENLKKHLDQHYGALSIPEKSISPTYEINSGVLNLELVNLIETMAPFGQGVPAPIWSMREVEIIDLDWMGPEKNHLRLAFKAAGDTFTAVKFRASDWKENIKVGQKVDLQFTLRRQVWQGREKLQPLITDLA